MINDITWAALDYLKFGWSVIPLRPRHKAPQGNILPVTSNRQGWEIYQARRASYDEISQWFERRPALNLGIVTGTISNLVVIDLDTEQGIGEFKKITAGHTSTGAFVKTTRGYHCYFAYPQGLAVGNRAHILPGIDVRGEGGYVVAPPSVHPSGTPYEWASFPPHKGVLGAIPAALIKLIRDAPPERIVPKAIQQHGIGANADAALCILNWQLDCLSRAPDGSRNDQLNLSAFTLARVVASGALYETDVRAALATTALGIGLEDKEISQTINSGFKAGLCKPWLWHRK